MKSPNRNKFKRWIRPGAWEDMDGHAHLDVPGIHQWMRDHGFSIVDTPKEIEDTIAKLSKILTEQHGFPPELLIIRRTRKD